MFKEVSFTVLGIPQAKALLKATELKDETKFMKLAEETRDYMRELIYSRRRGGKRIPSKLAESITAEKLSGRYFAIFGVGKISALPKYWKDADKGMVIPGKKFGYFEGYRGPDPSKAGTGIGKEVFTSQAGGFYLKPKYPANPLNYITDTYTWVATVFNLRK